MHAHRTSLPVPESREVTIRLPSDFPPGDAEIIVLSSAEALPAALPPLAMTEILPEFSAKFPWAGTFGPVLFHEDPRTPLPNEEWGEDLK